MSTQTQANKKNQLAAQAAGARPRVSVRMLVQVGMLAAISVVLMLFEIPLPFAPSFSERAPREAPAMVGSSARGPGPPVAIELVKILLNFVINGTATAGVGEMANFVIGCSFVVPAGIIYRRNHTRKGALVGMVAGTVLMVVLGCFINAFVLLPAYGRAFEMPIEALVGMGTAVNPHITSLGSFVILAVAPFNLLKGVLVSVIVMLIYKKISPVLKMK